MPDPERRWKIDLTKAEWRDDPRPLFEGASTPHSRAYLHYLTKNKELTGARILTLHNLEFMARLMARHPRGDPGGGVGGLRGEGAGAARSRTG